MAVTKLSEANGATVDIAELSLSPMSGTMKLAGLGIADRDDLTKNTVEVGEVSARASMYQMSLGRLVMDEVKVSNVQFDKQRDTPAKVVAVPGGDGGTPSEEESAHTSSIPDANAADLENYLGKYEEFKAWLEKIKPWLPQGQDEPAPVETPHKYLDFLTAKGGAEEAVRLWAKEVVMEKVLLGDQQFGSSTIRLTNLNDAPQAAELPIGIEVTSDAGAKMTMQMHFDDPATPGKVTGTFDAFDLSKLQGSLKKDNALQFESGLAGGKWEGFITQERIDVSVTAELTQLRANTQKGLFGLDPKVTQEALSTLENLAVSMRLSGPLTDPQISFDTGDLKKQIVAAGKKRVMGEIEKQIQDKAPDELKAILDSNDVKSNDFKKGLDQLIKR
jgi:hypothetical protein